MKIPLFIALLLACSGCATRPEDVEKYAVVRKGDDGRIQVSIEGTYRTPLFSTEGFGGSRRALVCWATLTGTGSEYKDPTLHINEPFLRKAHTGIIVVDQKKKTVVIRLDQIIPESGKRGIGGIDPDAKSGPSPLNGTYVIKEISNEKFITPE